MPALKTQAACAYNVPYSRSHLRLMPSIAEVQYNVPSERAWTATTHRRSTIGYSVSFPRGEHVTINNDRNFGETVVLHDWRSSYRAAIRAAGARPALAHSLNGIRSRHCNAPVVHGHEASVCGARMALFNVFFYIQVGAAAGSMLTTFLSLIMTYCVLEIV